MPRSESPPYGTTVMSRPSTALLTVLLDLVRLVATQCAMTKLTCRACPSKVNLPSLRSITYSIIPRLSLHQLVPRWPMPRDGPMRCHIDIVRTGNCDQRWNDRPHHGPHTDHSHRPQSTDILETACLVPLHSMFAPLRDSVVLSTSLGARFTSRDISGSCSIYWYIRTRPSRPTESGQNSDIVHAVIQQVEC